MEQKLTITKGPAYNRPFLDLDACVLKQNNTDGNVSLNEKHLNRQLLQLSRIANTPWLPPVCNFHGQPC